MKTRKVGKTDISRFHGAVELDETGVMQGKYELDDGCVCKYSLRRQAGTARYLVRGSVVLQNAAGYSMKVRRRVTAAGRPGDDERKNVWETAKASINATTDNAEVLRQQVAEAAKKLHDRNILALVDSAEKTVTASEMSFSLAVAIYAKQYAASRSRSAEMQHTRHLRLKRVANLIPSVRISSISLKLVEDICGDIGSRWRDYVQEASGFLDFVFRLKRDSDDSNVFSEYLRRNPTKCEKSRERLRKMAVNSDILPFEEERKLNQEILSNVGNGVLIGVTLVKEGGLSAGVTCELKWNAVLFTEMHGITAAFISYHLDELAGATHDYTFPLFPLGAKILQMRWNWLLEQGYSETQIRKMHIASREAAPMERLEPKELTQACRNILHNVGVGYAALTGMQELQMGAGVKILLSTYSYRLEEVCGLKDDPAVVRFLKHESLANMLQANHYRCFRSDGAAVSSDRPGPGQAV